MGNVMFHFTDALVYVLALNKHIKWLKIPSSVCMRWCLIKTTVEGAKATASYEL